MARWERGGTQKRRRRALTARRRWACIRAPGRQDRYIQSFDEAEARERAAHALQRIRKWGSGYRSQLRFRVQGIGIGV